MLPNARPVLAVLLCVFGGHASALAHVGPEVPAGAAWAKGLAFATPAIDLRLRCGDDKRAGVCSMQKQQHPHHDEATPAAADKLRRADKLGESEPVRVAAGGEEGADDRMGSDGVMLASRRSAIGVGLGLLLGEMRVHACAFFHACIYAYTCVGLLILNDVRTSRTDDPHDDDSIHGRACSTCGDWCSRSHTHPHTSTRVHACAHTH